MLSGSGAGDAFRLEWDTGAILEREVREEVAALTGEEAAAVAAVARSLDQAWGKRLARPSFLEHFASPLQYEAWLERNEPLYRRRWDRRHDELAELIATVQAAIRDTNSAAELIPPLFAVRDRFWDLNAFGWSGPQALGWICEALLVHTVRQHDSGFRSASVLGGGVDSHTSAVTRALQDLGRSIDETAVREAFLGHGLGEVLGHLEETEPGCEFLARYEALCWKFGKTPPSWRARPRFWRTYFDEGDAATMHTLRCALKGESRDVAEVQRDARRERERGERRRGSGDRRARSDRRRCSAARLRQVGHREDSVTILLRSREGQPLSPTPTFAVIATWPGWERTRSSQARTAANGRRSKPPSWATWV